MKALGFEASKPEVAKMIAEIDKDGYLRYTLNRKHYFLHRILAK